MKRESKAFFAEAAPLSLCPNELTAGQIRKTKICPGDGTDFS